MKNANGTGEEESFPLRENCRWCKGTGVRWFKVGADEADHDVCDFCFTREQIAEIKKKRSE